MITYSDNLYIGDTVKHINRIKRKIKLGKGQIRLYLITLANNCDQLDIFHNSMLKQRFYRKLDLKVVGIANSYDEALLLIQDILEDTMAETGTTDMKSYLQSGFCKKG